MLTRRPRRVAGGHSLVEVMVAILIFAVGLFGVAAMLLGATRASANALSRSQAAILSSFIVERMRSNPLAVAAGAFDAVALGDGAARASTSCAGSDASCSPSSLAAFDTAQWQARVEAELPNVGGGITCAPAGTLRRCTVTMTWDQSLARRELGAGATDSIASETYRLEVTL